MSTPVMPISLIIYKMVREYEETNRTKQFIYAIVFILNCII